MTENAESGARIAVPTTGGRLSEHFGHCDAIEIYEVDPARRAVVSAESVEAPPHEPGALPARLAELGVNVVIAAGMGRRAQELFRSRGIEVVIGAGGSEPRQIVASYLEGTLKSGPNLCDH
jgi:predicted Fe-Mo cluster-binding NifX family protein